MMTKQQAIAWVKAHEDDDDMDESQLEEVFEALYDRAPDAEDKAEGLWSHVCAAVED
jgi:hypothetical protein